MDKRRLGQCEFIESNRPLVIPNDVDAITFEDVVLAWEDIDAPENKYAAPVKSCARICTKR